MKRLLVRLGLVAAVAAGVGLAVLVSNRRAEARLAKFQNDIDNLFAGLQQYKEHVGTYPTGNNAQIVKALLGQNPKNVIILVSRKNELNEKGELVDPWGTPLRIYFSDTSVLIRSAGPNGRFDNRTGPECDDLFWSN